MVSGTSLFLDRRLKSSLNSTQHDWQFHDQTLLHNKNMPQEQKETKKHRRKLAGGGSACL